MRIAVEIVACLIMVGGIVVIFIERFRSKRASSTRTLQLLTVSVVLPTILILALEDVLDRQTTAALIGVIVGFSLAGVGRDGGGQP
jgi:hypothetical protein